MIVSFIPMIIGIGAISNIDTYNNAALIHTPCKMVEENRHYTAIAKSQSKNASIRNAEQANQG